MQNSGALDKKTSSGWYPEAKSRLSGPLIKVKIKAKGPALEKNRAINSQR